MKLVSNSTRHGATLSNGKTYVMCTNTEIMESLFEQVQEEYPDLTIEQRQQLPHNVFGISHNDQLKITNDQNHGTWMVLILSPVNKSLKYL